MNQKPEPSGPAPVTLQFNAGDSSPFGHGGCHLRVPPQDVVSAYGLRPYHSATMEGEWKIGEAVSQIGENLARSEHCTDKIKDHEKWPNALFAFDGPEFVLVQRRTAVAYAPTRQQAMDRLAWFSGNFKSAAAPETPSFHIINTSYGSLRAERVEVALDFAPQEGNLDLYYGEDFVQWHGEFVETIVERRSGLSLLEGPPGTGKTSYLRMLMVKLASTHRFYYLPPTSLSSLVQSEFVDFWVEEIERHGRDRRFVVVLEDCEAALMTRGNDNRSQVSSILNISDGMFADFLRTHVVCTINCPSAELDAALLRPGRLVAHRFFGKLPRGVAEQLAVYLGRDLEPGAAELSLAEVFAGRPLRGDKGRSVGFQQTGVRCP
jgi:hypothetical protein